MATDMGHGIMAPSTTDSISKSGVDEMRNLAATAALALGTLEFQTGESLTLLLPRNEAEQYGIPGPPGDEGQVGKQGIAGPGAVENDAAVASYFLADQSQTQAAADGRYLRGGIRSVSVDEFGAAGDGVTDDTARIQAALDSGASMVWVPGQPYRISASLRVPASVTFFTQAGTLVSDTPGLDVFITAWGSYLGSKKRELAVEASSGDRILTTKVAHDYLPGDILRLISQRISTNPTDAGDEQLGWATVGGPGPFFAEFVRVQNVTAQTVTLDSGLLFKGYRPDNSAETDPNAGTSAYLTDTNGSGDNARIFGFTLEGEAAYGIRIIRAKNVRIRDVEWDRELPGRFIQFQDCYFSDAERCYTATLQWGESHGEVNGVDHAAINQYHCVASWHSGFTNCRSVRGTQPYDFTYSSTSPYPSVNCYVRRSTAEGNLHNPVTAHPGTYGIIVDGNTFTECQQSGISIRSNAAEVTHNIVRGSGVGSGIYVLEGGGKTSRVESNTVENFDIAARLNDGADKPFRDRVDTVFRNNTFRGFRVGWVRTRMFGQSVPGIPQGIGLTANRFESDLRDATAIITCESARGINGLAVQGNEFILRGENTTAILLTANSKGTAIAGNVFHAATRRFSYDPAGHVGGAAMPDTVTWGANETMPSVSATMPANTATLKISSPSRELLVLNEDPVLEHFTTQGRWRTASAGQVKIINGFPVDGGSGWWEVEPLAAGYVEQTFRRVGTASVLFRRRCHNGTPEPWTSITFA